MDYGHDGVSGGSFKESDGMLQWVAPILLMRFVFNNNGRFRFCKVSEAGNFPSQEKNSGEIRITQQIAAQSQPEPQVIRPPGFLDCVHRKHPLAGFLQEAVGEARRIPPPG